MCTNQNECNKKDTIASVGKDVEKLKPSYLAGGYVKWYRYFGKTVWQFLRKVT